MVMAVPIESPLIYLFNELSYLMIVHRINSTVISFIMTNFY